MQMASMPMDRDLRRRREPVSYYADPIFTSMNEGPSLLLSGDSGRRQSQNGKAAVEIKHDPSKATPKTNGRHLNGIESKGRVASDTRSATSSASPTESQASSKRNSTSSTNDTNLTLTPDQMRRNEPIHRFKRKYAGQMMDIECNNHLAKLDVDLLPDLVGAMTHAKRKCILFNDEWITPTEYETAAGFGSRKNWRSSVRMNGRSIKGHIDALASEAVAEDLDDSQYGVAGKGKAQSPQKPSAQPVTDRAASPVVVRTSPDITVIQSPRPASASPRPASASPVSLLRTPSPHGSIATNHTAVGPVLQSLADDQLQKRIRTVAIPTSYQSPVAMRVANRDAHTPPRGMHSSPPRSQPSPVAIHVAQMAADQHTNNRVAHPRPLILTRPGQVHRVSHQPQVLDDTMPPALLPAHSVQQACSQHRLEPTAAFQPAPIKRKRSANRRKGTPPTKIECRAANGPEPLFSENTAENGMSITVTAIADDDTDMESYQVRPQSRSARGNKDLDLMARHPLPSNHPYSWSCHQVADYLRAWSQHKAARACEHEEVDGRAFLKLREEHLLNRLHMSLGPALNILELIAQLNAYFLGSETTNVAQ